MKLPGRQTIARTFALILIIGALLGTATSYKLTLETRFDALELKLQQNAVALQQFQSTVDALTASKTETLANLNKQVDSLQSSFIPLGKATIAQNDCLAQLHQEVSALQQLAAEQADAQKKLSAHLALVDSHVTAISEPTPLPPAAPTPAVGTAAVPTLAVTKASAAAVHVTSAKPAVSSPSTPTTTIPLPPPLALNAHLPAKNNASVAALTPLAVADASYSGLDSTPENIDLISPGTTAERAHPASTDDAGPSPRAVPVDAPTRP